MKTPQPTGLSPRGFTLLEMSIVLMVLLSLLGVGLYSSRKMDDWRLARDAAETLRIVHSAQRLYLADHPTKDVSTIVAADIIPYLPTKAAALPTVKSLTGATLSILVNQSPPRINNGSGAVYDPSGPSDKLETFKDSLWDVGE